MARKRRVPSLTHHKPSGQARVRLDGRDVYLGPWGSPLAEAEYRRVVAEWLSVGVVPDRPLRGRSPVGPTVGELARGYRAHLLQRMSERVYRGTVRAALIRLDRLYGHTPADTFSPASLEAFLQACASEKRRCGERLSRGYINAKLLPNVKRLFKWGVRKGPVPPSVWHGLCAVGGLERGHAGAPDRDPVRPVDDDVVEQTLPRPSAVIADMVQLQRLTGMRPGEGCMIRWSEVDTTGAVWVFRPAKHKTAHHGKRREVALGPRAQSLLMKYRHRAPELPVLSPAESESKRLAEAHAARKTPVQPSQRARAQRAATQPRRKYRDGYTTAGYALAIRRAMKRAFRPEGMGDEEFKRWDCPQHWHPNQLRHTYATEIRRGFGLDAAGALLGHTKLETTQVYAERNLELAIRVAQAVG